MIFCICLSRANGLITSGILHLTWILCTICAFPNIYDWFIKGFDIASLETCAQLVWIVGVFVQTFIFCIADSRQLEEKERFEISPKDSASFINDLLFWWINALIKTGANKNLEMEDLFELSYEQRSQILFPIWEHYWLPTTKSI